MRAEEKLPRGLSAFFGRIAAAGFFTVRYWYCRKRGFLYANPQRTPENREKSGKKPRIFWRRGQRATFSKIILSKDTLSTKSSGRNFT